MTDFISHSDGTLVDVKRVRRVIKWAEDALDQKHMWAEALRNHEDDECDRVYEEIRDSEMNLNDLYESIGEEGPY